MKLAHHFDHETLLFLSSTKVFLIAGYDDYCCPQFATWVSLPDFDAETQQCRFNKSSQNWQVEAKLIKVAAYHKSTREPKEFDDESLVTDEYVTAKPTTQFDEWIDNAWVTNLSNQYIFEYNQVDDERRRIYAEVINPLELEAQRKERQGDTVLAQDYYNQANAAEIEMKQRHPFPAPPQY